MPTLHDHDPPPARPLAILDANGRPLWAALGGPGYAYDARLEALWRAGQRAERIVQLRLFEEENTP